MLQHPVPQAAKGRCTMSVHRVKLTLLSESTMFVIIYHIIAYILSYSCKRILVYCVIPYRGKIHCSWYTHGPSRYDAICNIMQYSHDTSAIYLWYVMAKSYYCAPTVHLTTDQFTIYIVSMIHTYTFRLVHRHCILAVYCEDIDLRYVCHCTLSTIQICHHMSTPTSDLCRTKKHIIDVSHDTWYV